MIRIKTTPSRKDGHICVRVDYVNVEDERVTDIVFTEEFQIREDRQGCSYVSRAEFEAGHALPGTFWLDEEGRRHFHVKADPGFVGLFGTEAGFVKG